MERPLDIRLAGDPDGTVVLTVQGEVDMLTAPQLDRALEAAVDQAVDGVVVDISQLDFIDIAGFRVLHAGQLRCRRHDRWFLVLSDSRALTLASLLRPYLPVDVQLARHATVHSNGAPLPGRAA